MRVKHFQMDRAGAPHHRDGTAAVEFAFCAPLLVLLLFGLWEVGRITEVQNILWNSGREAARDASMGQLSLQSVASNLLTYLQGADSVAFGQGHTTSMISPVVTLPANTTGYTCWDNTTNQELFTVTFSDLTTTTVTDPTSMTQLDRFQIGVQVPYSNVGWLPTAKITGATRLYVAVQWASMVDTPFEIAPSLPAQ